MPKPAKVDAASLRSLAEDVRAAKAKSSGGATEKTGLKSAEAAPKSSAKPQRSESPAQAADDEDRSVPLPQRRVAASNGTEIDRRAQAQALLSKARAKSAAADNSLDVGASLPYQGRPQTYRIDGPSQPQVYGQSQTQQSQAQQSQVSQSQGSQPQGYGGALLGTNGLPVASYPRSPSNQFEPPQQVAQANGFEPPDLAPGAGRQTDPKALMEALEQLRSRRAVQPARAERETPETTGSVAGVAGEFTPSSALTFVQFEKDSAVLSVSGQAAIADMLKPYLKTKGVRMVAAVGLGGPGEAYVKLLQANQRAQAIAAAIPQGFELIRRFDPGLPNESVRLFVVKSGP